MTEEVFDVVFIGGGPGGYVGAIRAAQLGLKTACIEKREQLGGTCLNEGCIPSKALLHSSHLYEATKHMGDYGVKVGNVELDLATMLKHKETIVKDLGRGIDGLFKKYKVTRFQGIGKIESPSVVSITGNNGNVTKINTKNIVLATGSDIARLPGLDIDSDKVISSKDALELKSVPKSMIVIGGGYIGLEMGSVWRRLGTEVIIVEYFDRIVPMIDHEIGNHLYKALEKQGMKFYLSTKVTGAKVDKNGVTLTVEPSAGGKAEELKADIVLLSVGRKPYTDGLGLDTIGVNLDKTGRVIVDHHYSTNVRGIFALGDIISGPMLAHKAEEEGVAVAEIIAGQAGHVNYGIIPSVIYTTPEVASVGKTEEELKAAGVDYKVGKFPFMANSRARAISDTSGVVKILACAKKDRILGAHIIGADAGTMIHEVVTAMEYGASSEDLARTCHAHPTLNEAIKEAALSVLGRPIHM